MNNDLISRSALLADAEKCGVMLSSSMSPSDEEIGARKVIYAIVSAPAVDAVEVVRCENCIYNDSETHIPDLSIAIFSTAQKTLTGTAMKEKGEQNERNTY